MEDFLYAYNQPKQFGKYDFFLDGKITANEVVYKILTENGEYQNIDIAEKVKEIEERLKVHFTFQPVPELPEVGDETVIYLVENAATSDDPDVTDKYDEYMWVKKEGEEKGKFELIGSGTYAQQKAELEAESNRAIGEEERIEKKLDQEIADRIADVNAEKNRATAAEGTLDKKIDATKTALQDEIDADIKVEKDRAEAAEKVLTDAVSDEKERATEEEADLQSQITKLQRAVVVLELPNCEIDNETVSQEYIVGNDPKSVTVKVNAAKGTMAVGTITANVTVNEEIQDTMDVKISQLGALSGSKKIDYTLGKTETIEKSSKTNQDGSTTVTITTTPYTHKLTINVAVSGEHKEPSVTVSFDKTEEAGTPDVKTETTYPEESETPTEPTE